MVFHRLLLRVLKNFPEASKKFLLASQQPELSYTLKQSSAREKRSSLDQTVHLWNKGQDGFPYDTWLYAIRYWTTCSFYEKRKEGIIFAEQSALKVHYSFSYKISIHSFIALFSKLPVPPTCSYPFPKGEDSASYMVPALSFKSRSLDNGHYCQ